MKVFLVKVELTDSCLLRSTTDNAPPNSSMIHKLPSTLEASRIEWPGLRYYIPCMAHIIQLALSAFMSSVGVEGWTKSLKSHERNQQFGENESIAIGKSQRLREEGNSSINMASAMRSGLAMIPKKVHISRYCESPETDLYIAENACCMEYADTWSLKWVHWVSKCTSLHSNTTYYGCEDTSELATGVSWANLTTMRIHPLVSPTLKIERLLASRYNTGWMDPG